MTKNHRLYLFDYDHTIIVPEKVAYESLEYAAKIIRPVGAAELDWNLISTRHGGTTEKYLAQLIAEYYRIPDSQFASFESSFYAARTRFLAERGVVYGDIYDDALVTLRKLENDPEAVVMLVTGNPRSVIEQRMNPKLRNFFQNRNSGLRGAFGDEKETRKDLILLAIQRAQEKGFEVTTDQYGIKRNVYYIGDTPNELLSGIEAKVMTVFVPNHGGDNISARNIAGETVRKHFETNDKRLFGSRIDVTPDSVEFGRQQSVFSTGLLSQPQASDFLDVSTHPIYSPERESYLRGSETRGNKKEAV